MINKTEGTGEPKIDMRLCLGELGSAKPGALTPDRPKACPDSPHEPEGALRVTIAWARPLRASSNTVPFATEQAYA